MKIMTFNARSLCNKTVGVTEFLKQNDCDICFITEAWLKIKDTSIVAELRDFGYDVIFQPRKCKRGGGVCVLFRSGIDVKKCTTNGVKHSTFELLEVVIKSNNDLFRVSTFYRTGKMSVKGRELFETELDQYLLSLVQKKGDKLLCGDFNIHVQAESNLDKTKTKYFGNLYFHIN